MGRFKGPLVSGADVVARQAEIAAAQVAVGQVAVGKVKRQHQVKRQQ